MTLRDARRLAACLTLILAMTSGSPRARSIQIAPAPNDVAGRPIVYAAVVDGIILPISAEYMLDTLERADLAGAVLVVFTLQLQQILDQRTDPWGVVEVKHVDLPDNMQRAMARQATDAVLRSPERYFRERCRIADQ